MKWVPDTTGRFQWRPSYRPKELDFECERIVSGFLLGKYGAIDFPLSTDDLSIMIEGDTTDLDLYADLSGEGEEVEGLTDFFPSKKPAVKISRELSLDGSRVGRLRTTLAHEYGHVRFHKFLWDIAFKSEKTGNFWKTVSRQRRKLEVIRKKLALISDTNNPPPLLPGESFFAGIAPSLGPRCKRARILDAPVADWMEWQAAYISGALLMPVSPVRRFMQEKTREHGDDQILVDTELAGGLTAGVAALFDVSVDAAMVRLLKLGFLKQNAGSSHIFKPASAHR